MDDWIDVGLLAEPGEDEDEGAILVQQRVRLKSGENTVVLVSRKKPYRAVIDPMHLFIDRVPDDNSKKVE
jgi:hypothetical protein